MQGFSCLTTPATTRIISVLLLTELMIICSIIIITDVVKAPVCLASNWLSPKEVLSRNCNPLLPIVGLPPLMPIRIFGNGFMLMAMLVWFTTATKESMQFLTVEYE